MCKSLNNRLTWHFIKCWQYPGINVFPLGHWKLLVLCMTRQLSKTPIMTMITIMCLEWCIYTNIQWLEHTCITSQNEIYLSAKIIASSHKIWWKVNLEMVNQKKWSIGIFQIQFQNTFDPNFCHSAIAPALWLNTHKLTLPFNILLNVTSRSTCQILQLHQMSDFIYMTFETKYITYLWKLQKEAVSFHQLPLPELRLFEPEWHITIDFAPFLCTVIFALPLITPCTGPCWWNALVALQIKYCPLQNAVSLLLLHPPTLCQGGP